jgi:hypothetical protein
MNLDADAMLKESADCAAEIAAAFTSKRVLQAGQLAAASKLLAEAQKEIEELKKQLADKEPKDE